MDKRIVVKIGSNVLTRPDSLLDITRLSALVDQLAALRHAGYQIIVVSSGAVAAGRGELKNTQGLAKLDPVSKRQIFSAVGQAKLINRYYDLFREHGIHCGQVLATKENFDRRSHYLNQKNCMETMLAHGVVPIVNENDTVSLTELMFTDNDELSGLIAAMMDASRLIILSNIDGMYTGDPSDPASELIENVAPGEDPSQYVCTTRSSHGRGGMGSKCRIARLVAADGIEVTIANGTRPAVLEDLCLPGRAPVPHTTFEAAPKSASGIKKWIAHSGSFAKGTLTVNSGAAQALASAAGTSLLPVGVVSVDGDFDADDIVTVADTAGNTIGWGRVATDCRTAAKLAGKSGEKPLIHADYLYISEF